MTTVAALPTPLELNRLYEPTKPSIVLHVLGSAVFFGLVGLGFAWQESYSFLVFGLCGSLIGALWGLASSAGRWYIGNGQHAFVLTEDGFTVIDKEGRLDVPWHEISYAEHCLDQHWAFETDAPRQRRATISIATHDDEVMDAFGHLVRGRLPVDVEVKVVDLGVIND